MQSDSTKQKDLAIQIMQWTKALALLELRKQDRGTTSDLVLLRRAGLTIDEAADAMGMSYEVAAKALSRENASRRASDPPRPQ